MLNHLILKKIFYGGWLIFYFLISFCSGFSQPHWYQQHTINVDLKAIQMFYDNEEVVGYICGRDNFVARLSNFGDSLNILNIPDSSVNFYDLHFIDPLIGWVTGTKGAVFRTRDGGESWKYCNQKSEGGKYFTTLMNACFFLALNESSNKGWVGGSNGELWRTDNEGDMWSPDNLTSEGVVISSTIYDIFFMDKNLGYCVTRNGEIYRTETLGGFWYPESSGTTERLNAIYIFSSELDTIGWIVGRKGTILRSSTLPEGWISVGIPSVSTHFNGISVLSENEVYVVGDDGFVLHTTDSGQSWPDTFRLGTEDLNDIFAHDEDNIWIVGDQGANYYSEGTIQIDNTQIKDTLKAKTNQDIFFTTQFNKYVDIFFSDDNGVSWKDTIAIKHLTDTGKFLNWIVPDINSTECEICIRSNYPNKKTVADTSNTFVVYTTDPPEIESIPDTLTGRIGEPITICAKVKSKRKPITVKLFYRQGGDLAPRYKNIEMDTVKGSPNSYKREIKSIDDFEIGKYGVEFYIEASYNIIKKISSTYPYTNARESPCSIPILIQNLEHEIITSEPGNERYQMLSIPLNYQSDEGTIRNVLFDDMGGSYDKHKWRLFRWENGGKVEFPNPSVTWEFEPGRAFWIVCRSDSITTGEAFSVTRADSVIDLPEKGWYQVANPFAFDVSVTSINLDSLSGFYEWIPDSGKYKHLDASDVLESFKGYFIRSDADNQSLIIPPVKATTMGNILKKNQNQLNWKIILDTQSSGISGGSLIFGYSSFASDQFDHLDMLDPPPPYKPMLKSYIPHPDWQIFKGNYRADIRAIKKEGDFWDFNIESENTGFIDLTFDLDDRIPINHQVILLSNDSNKPQYLNENPHYRYRNSVKGSVKQFRLIVGTQKYIAEQVTHHKPTEFTLFQNYPNPFNTTTTIQYALPIASKVSLHIYNVRGEKVAILMDTVQKKAGFYAQIWNGTDSSGNKISSGLYFYQIKTASFSDTKKMILVK